MTKLAIFSPIKLGPVVASPPYTEGEFYSVEKRKVAVQVTQLSPNLIFLYYSNCNTVQCHIEGAPAGSLVILTYNITITLHCITLHYIMVINYYKL